MFIAKWNDQIIAQSDNTLMIEGNHYFPREDVNMDYFTESQTTTHCPWKGDASYFNIKVNDQENTDAAWTYSQPLPDAAGIVAQQNEGSGDFANYIAFWKGVEITQEDEA